MFEDLIDPLKVFLGKDKSKIPQHNNNLVTKIYGIEMLNKILRLRDEFYDCKYERHNDDINWQFLFNTVKTEFLKKEPECSIEIIDLLWWEYSYKIWKDGHI